MSVHIGYVASKSAVAILKADPPLTSLTNFYSEMEDPDTADGNSNNVRDHPCAICSFESGQEVPMLTGNYNGILVIKVELSADDHTAAQAEQIFSDVFSRFSTDSIIADLSSSEAGFTAFGFWQGIQQTPQTIEGDAVKRLRCKSILLPINCCASDFT